MVANHFIVAVLLLGVAWAQLDPDRDIHDSQNAPSHAEGGLLSSVTLKNMCLVKGGADAYAKFYNESKNFNPCVERLVISSDSDIIKKKSEGEILREEFKKYCPKKFEVEGCARGVLESAKLCFTKDEQKHLNIFSNMPEHIIDFLCVNDGERFALFTTNGGVECVEKQMAMLQGCVSSMGRIFGIDINHFTPDTQMDFNIGEKECKKFATLRSCLVDQLQGCPQPTTDIVEDFFKYAFIDTPCKNLTGSASGLAVTSLTLIMVAISSLLV